MERSYFADLVYAAADERVVGLPPVIVGSVEQAKERLARCAQDRRADEREEQNRTLAREGRASTLQRRDLTSTVTAGGYFSLGGSPHYVSAAFATAVRAAAVLPGILPVNPLPDFGMSLSTPRITTGSTAATQHPENAALADQDIVEALATSPIATIEASASLSQQLLDRADPAMVDTVLAQELGRAMAAQLDAQILAGTGANHQMLGLIAVTGIGTAAYTDASPTQSEAFAAVLGAAAAQSIALGQAPDATLLHPRRRYWFSNWTATSYMPLVAWPAETVDVPGIPTTSEYILLLKKSELPLYLGPVKLRAVVDVTGSGVLTAKVYATQYASNLFSRRPEAIVKISGTGLADSPVFA